MTKPLALALILTACSGGGPYPDNRAAALDDVDTARRIAMDLDPRAHWYAYGTVRVESAVGPGLLNRHGFMEALA